MLKLNFGMRLIIFFLVAYTFAQRRQEKICTMLNEIANKIITPHM
jgi:hypothetical protein